MKYNLLAKNIDLSETDENMINEKLNRIEKHLRPPFMADLTFIRDNHHLKGDVVTCKITIQQGKKVYHADRSADSAQTALDQTIDALKSELEKDHDKRKQRHE